MTRLWAEGYPISVEDDADGVPLRFNWEDATHPVSLIVDQWRADSDWWRGRVWRMYFKIITETGLLAELFHDLLTDKWFMQRVYD
jgi:hypothetical protein